MKLCRRRRRARQKARKPRANLGEQLPLLLLLKNRVKKVRQNSQGYDIVAEYIVNANTGAEKLGREKSPSQDAQEGGSEEERREPTRKTEEGDYHPAQLHPPPPGASVAEYQGTTGAQQQGQDVPSTRMAQQVTVGAEKKHGFMTMVKGEMKILAGKMSGDEHKVEEGKKLVHGDA